MTQTVLDGGSFTTEKVRIGLAGELRFDSSNQDLLLHNGVKLGGYRFLNLDNALAKFQPKSVELDGLSGFAPEDRGLLVRLGPGSYHIRQVVGTTNQIDVTQGDGQSGDITLGLPDVIVKTSLRFAHSVRFSEGIVVQSGIETDGIHSSGTATVDGAATFNSTSHFVSDATFGNANGHFSGNYSGDIDIRGKTFQADNDSLSINMVNNLGTILTQLALPIGFIGLWGGSAASIPSGWHLCDGTGGTPDLRGLFIVGANSGNVGATGGSSTHTHTATIAAGGTHQHAITVAGHVLLTAEMPSHFHGNGVSDDNVGNIFPYGVMGAPSGGNVQDHSGTNSQQGKSETVGGDQAHAHTATMGDSPTHTHALTIDAHDNTPPYYALCYIMKVS